MDMASTLSPPMKVMGSIKTLVVHTTLSVALPETAGTIRRIATSSVIMLQYLLFDISSKWYYELFKSYYFITYFEKSSDIGKK